MDFSNLYFRNAPSFKSLALIEAIANAAKIFEFTAVLHDHSIRVVSVLESIDALRASGGADKAFLELLSAGTKPLDALAFMLVQSMDSSSSGNELRRKFKYEKVDKYIEHAYEDSCAAITSAYLIAVTRGALPGSSVASGKNPLPQLVRNMFVTPPKDEAELSRMLMSFDPKHISLNALFSESNLNDWPEEVANRMNLGVAGHKVMKACHMLQGDFISTDSTAKKISVLMAELAGKANGGFYPSLHPANNQLKNTFQKFYLQSLKALFDSLKGTKEEKYAAIERTGAFKSDSHVSGRKLDLLPQSYKTWDLEILTKLIGTPVKFNSYDVKTLKRLEMPLRENVEFTKRTESGNSQTDDGSNQPVTIVEAEGVKTEERDKTKVAEVLGSKQPGELKKEESSGQKQGKKGARQEWINK